MEPVQKGSCWEPGLWGPKPRWPTDPDVSVIESLCRKHLRVPGGYELSVTFLAQGALHKVYTIVTSDGNGFEFRPPCIFRVALPVEPFLKTASEVATLSYIRERTSVPVPRVIAHDSSADDKLGFEWILMEKVPGVPLQSLWREMNMEAKDKVTRAIAQLIKQLRDRCSFGEIGNIYFRDDISGKTQLPVPATDARFATGPIVTPFLFAGGRKLRLPRFLGPYPNDGDYMRALAHAEELDMEYLQSPEAREHGDFDEDVAEDAEEILGAIQELWKPFHVLFPSHSLLPPPSFALTHHDLSLSNVFVDPATYTVTGIIDWESTGPRPDWEDRYPAFLTGREISGEPEPLDPGDEDSTRVEWWESWEKTILRPSWDEELGDAKYDDNGADRMRAGWRNQLDWVEASASMVKNWVRREYGEWSSRMKLEA